MAVAARSSINRRLTATVLLTTFATLTIAFGAVALYDYSTFRKSMAGRADTLAEVVGINSAVALSFLDPMSAAQTLSALAAARPVVAAVVYDVDGDEFARYTAEGVSFEAPPAGLPGHEFSASHLDVRQPIVFNGEEIGTILIRWDTSELRDRMLSFLGIIAVLVVTVIGVAALISAQLRRQVSKPLADLVDGSEAIAGGNLAAKVVISTNDEIGVLGRSFNAMAGSLRGLVSQVEHGTRDVAEVSRMLEESSGTLSHEAQRQSVAIADTTESVDQVGRSIRGVNDRVERLSEQMRETSSSIAEMQASITEVAGHMDHLSESIETTSAAVNQVAANTADVVQGTETLMSATGDSLARLDQLKASVDQVRTNAQTSHELSADTSQEADRGLGAVQETIASMGEISASFHALEGSITRLSEKSASIDEILKVIQGVADQTSMLSLNASIIAAQAGEHGKAFSVVADEVSSLAQSTHRSTHEIANLIRAVREDTEAAVAAAEEGAAKVERGVQRSNVAGEVLQAISKKSRASTERVHEIREAASRQIGDLKRVDQAMAAVNEIVERFSRSAKDQSNATAEIARAVESIRLLGLDVRRSTDEQRRGSALITNAVTEVAGLVSDIVESTKAQTKSSENIGHALEVFRDVTTETNRRVEAINEMVQLLSDRSTKLAQEIGRFRTH